MSNLNKPNASGRSTNRQGMRYGRLLAIRQIPHQDHGKQHGHAVWECVCDCGNVVHVNANSLRTSEVGGTRSCGCLLREKAAARNRGRAAWNKDASYTNKPDGVYSTKHGWTKAVIRARGNRCQRCGWDAASCDVHHIIPKKNGGENTIANAEVVCPNCHRIAHESAGYAR